MYSTPLAYFITMRCYGTWLHGDERGSVDRGHSGYGRAMLARNPARVEFERKQMAGPARSFSDDERVVIEATVQEVCRHRDWRLESVAARTNHVHIIVQSPISPEGVMNSFKSWCTRRLREGGLIESDARVWSRHGSTKYLFTPDELARARWYVEECQ